MNVYFQAFKIIKSSRSFLNQGAELKALIGEEDFNKTVGGYTPQQTDFAARLIGTQDFLLQWEFREYFVKKYAWAITDPIAINFISKYCTTNKLKLIEVGAGSGYWASLLSQKKVDCLCFDLQRRDTTFFPVNYGNTNCIKNNKDRLEQQIKLIRSDSIATKNSDALTVKINASIEQINETNKWIGQMNEFKDVVGDNATGFDQRIGFSEKQEQEDTRSFKNIHGIRINRASAPLIQRN